MQDQIKVNGVQYRLQPRKCGKAGCRCNTPGQEHGPYWYSYDGNSAAKYVGAKLPDFVTKHIALLKASGAKLKAIKAKIKKRRDDSYRVYSLANQDLRTVEALEAGERIDSQRLFSLGLAQFNGHEKRG